MSKGNAAEDQFFAASDDRKPMAARTHANTTNMQTNVMAQLFVVGRCRRRHATSTPVHVVTIAYARNESDDDAVATSKMSVHLVRLNVPPMATAAYMRKAVAPT
ncbi:hypothetical protein H310_03404 [Aphanomyces invadans]|uniref:Uncharacterized protein n=1 Tax=Aphanomyces invadans TaxID=157072 RepID=A0A024UHK6_9STRA|nr:hypothetical protein H310_03404 [Aphanomyces invadans]ETW05685.1 hypothetical protein H310_03404 [Aphanomyces invadans]|eukprot:XP_008865462.1 hypothetical protein H310_03404 [Aphanomyces invadans]